MRIIVETVVKAPIEVVWDAYTNPKEIVHWNFASDDWCCPSSTVDLRVGGQFSSRMEAKDGSMGFDFAGTYIKVEPNQLLEYQFGDRVAEISFNSEESGVRVVVSFDPETENPVEMQQMGWQAILNNFARHVEAG